jgi:hypothetical protein
MKKTLRGDRAFDLTIDPEVAYRIAVLAQSYQGEGIMPLIDDDVVDSDVGDDPITDMDVVADEAGRSYGNGLDVDLADDDAVDLDDRDDPIADEDVIADEAGAYDEDMEDDELDGLIRGLNVDAKHDLLALIWVGRGDYDAGDWSAARKAAREAEPFDVTDYLEELQMGSDYIENALDAMGYPPPEGLS